MSVHYDQFLPLAKTQWRWIKGTIINRLQLFATVSDMSGLSPWRIQKNFHNSFKITEDRISTYGININKQKNQLDRLNWKVAFLYFEHTLIDFPSNIFPWGNHWHHLTNCFIVDMKFVTSSTGGVTDQVNITLAFRCRIYSKDHAILSKSTKRMKLFTNENMINNIIFEKYNIPYLCSGPTIYYCFSLLLLLIALLYVFKIISSYH